jgi:anti-sigma factor RsiW
VNTSLDHYSEEAWENYARGKLSERDSALLEEHLLLCPACQDLLANVDEYLEIAQSALEILRAGQANSQPAVSDTKTRRRLSKAAGASGTLR